MSTFEELLPENLHHAYIIEGDIESIPVQLRTYLKKRKYIDENEMDFLYQSFDSFTMSDVPPLNEWNTTHAVSLGKKVCIIKTKFINHEAQQSLLKMIEEPRPNTHFFFILPKASTILPTVLSRVHLIKLVSTISSPTHPLTEIFLTAEPTERIQLIAKIIEDSKKNSSSAGLRFEAMELMSSIEKYMHSELKNQKNIKNNAYTNIKQIEKCRTYLDSPGASVKMLLEHIALVL